MTTLLSLKKLTKRFGGLVAVDHVNFDVEAGSIVGLIGPNGAGKTTVFNLITGNYRPDEGDVIFDGRSIKTLPTHQIVSLGIARTFQTIRLFQKLAAIENVLAGCHCRMQSGSLAAMFRTPAQRREEQEALQTALKELEFVGLQSQADQLAENLSYGNQRLLEIARALATQPRFIILDEPAGGGPLILPACRYHLSGQVTTPDGLAIWQAEVTISNGANQYSDQTDALGHRTEYLYDDLGRLIGQTDAEGDQTVYHCYVTGAMLSLTDPVDKLFKNTLGLFGPAHGHVQFIIFGSKYGS